MAGIPTEDLIRTISNKLSKSYDIDSDSIFKYLIKANLIDVLRKEGTGELKKDIEIFLRNEKIEKIRSKPKKNL